MYAITGITGQVGGVVARALLDAGQTVRAAYVMTFPVDLDGGGHLVKRKV